MEYQELFHVQSDFQVSAKLTNFHSICSGEGKMHVYTQIIGSIITHRMLDPNLEFSLTIAYFTSSYQKHDLIQLLQ